MGKPGLSFEGLTQGWNGLGKGLLLKVHGAELCVHLCGLGRQLTQLLEGPGRVVVAPLREGPLPLLCVSLEPQRVGLLGRSRRSGQVQRGQDQDECASWMRLYARRSL